MIAFLQPLALLALAAAAGPALLHLLQRREPPVVPFPAVQYLQDAAQRHSRRLRLRNLLLLILRTLAILLLALAAARPVARIPAGTGHAPMALALVVDHSLSSGAVVGGARVADTLVARARRIVAAVTADDHLWLVLADGVPRRVSRPEAERLLADLGPTSARLDLGAAVRAAAQAVAAADLPGQVVVLTDNQAAAWSPGAAAADVLVWSAAGPAENRGIDSVRRVPTIWPGRGALLVSVGGTGAPAAVRLEMDGTTLDRALAAPGDVVELAGALPAGWYAGRVVLDGDELRADDERPVAVRVAPPAAAVAAPGAGAFVSAAVAVLRETGRFAGPGAGVGVALDDALGPGIRVLLPPADPALVGVLNRQLEARGIPWRFGSPVAGGTPRAAQLELGDALVTRRYALAGSGGVVVATVDGTPWIVRAGDVVLVGSRLEEAWTDLPARAAFIPFLDALVNQVAAADAWLVDAVPGAVVQLPAGGLTLTGAAGDARVDADGRVTAPLATGVWFALRGTDTVGALAVHPDPRESRLQPASERQLAAALATNVRVDGGMTAADVFAAATARADLTTWLLLLALGVLMAEFALAASVGRAGD